MKPRRVVRSAERRINAWSAYWARARAPSAPVYGAEDPLVDFVEAKIVAAGKLAGPKPRILDIGAGKGFLTGWIRHVLPNADVHTTDAADLVPQEHPEKHVRAFAERLPHEPGGFDIVMSTFAIDYAQREKFANEMRRVLKGRGTAVLLLHHPQGRIVSNMRLEQDTVAAELSYLRRFRQFIVSGNRADLEAAAGSLRTLRDFKQISAALGGSGPEDIELYANMLAQAKAAKESKRPNPERERAWLKGVNDAIRDHGKGSGHTRWLLNHGKRQLFANEAEMRRFFLKHKFAVLESAVILEPKDDAIRLKNGRAVVLARKGDPRAYGIVLRK